MLDKCSGLDKRSGSFPVFAALIFTVASFITPVLLNASVLLKVGDTAPEFTLPGSDGKDYSLSEFRDKAFVVIAFFPKAFTGG